MINPFLNLYFLYLVENPETVIYKNLPGYIRILRDENKEQTSHIKSYI